MLALVGSRVWYRTIGHGVFHCERCGGDRPYRHRSGRRWAHLLGVPGGLARRHRRAPALRRLPNLLPGGAAGRADRGADARRAPRRDERGGTRDAERPAERAVLAARRRGVQMIRDAGAPEYDDARLVAALADPDAAAQLPEADGQVVGLRPAIEAFSIQLDIPAREWFLAKVVEVGLADGSLSAAERDVAGTVARYLGMSAARGRDVISLAEESAAQAGAGRGAVWTDERRRACARMETVPGDRRRCGRRERSDRRRQAARNESGPGRASTATTASCCAPTSWVRPTASSPCWPARPAGSGR